MRVTCGKQTGHALEQHGRAAWPGQFHVFNCPLVPHGDLLYVLYLLYLLTLATTYYLLVTNNSLLMMYECSLVLACCSSFPSLFCCGVPSVLGSAFGLCAFPPDDEVVGDCLPLGLQCTTIFIVRLSCFCCGFCPCAFVLLCFLLVFVFLCPLRLESW